jgi:uncharacterized delta-60 repeat protein
MTRRTTIFLLLFTSTSFLNADFAPVSLRLDPAFQPVVTSPGGVRALASAPGGKLIAAGVFSVVNNSVRQNLVRLNADGTVDTSFDAGNVLPTELVGIVDVTAVPDGKIFVSGEVTLEGAVGSKLFRLNVDGTLDKTFVLGDLPISPDEFVNYVSVLGVLKNSNILANVTSQGLSRRFTVLCDPTGAVKSRVSAFDQGENEGVVKPFLLNEQDGSYILSDGASLIRFTPDGNITRLLATNCCSALLPLSDGTFIGLSESLAVEFNQDFSSYKTFELRIAGSAIPKLNFGAALDPAGRIMLWGFLGTINERPFNGIARLNPHGTVDETFQPPEEVVALLQEGDNPFGGALIAPIGSGILICRFAPVIGLFPESPALTMGWDGQLKASPQFRDLTRWPWSNISSKATPAQDGHLFVFGAFNQVNGKILSSLARLNFDGTTDTGFRPELPTNSTAVKEVAQQEDGTVVVVAITAGNWDRTLPIAVRRLKPDGSADPSFTQFNARASFELTSLAVQADRKILLATDNGVIRLLPDGAPDPSFIPEQRPAIGLTLMNDGRILTLTELPSASRNFIRLNQDGSVDPSFNVNLGVGLARPLKGGKLFAIASIKTNSFEYTTTIVRLNSDGSVDSSFNTDSFLFENDFISDLEPDLDGGVLVAARGPFFSFTRIIRLQSNGAIDQHFSPIQLERVSGDISFVRQENGDIIVSGAFGMANGEPRPGLARFVPVAGSSVLSMQGFTEQGLGLNLSATPNQQFEIQTSTDLNSWRSLTNLTATSSSAETPFLDPAPRISRKFYRALSHAN